MSAVPRRILSGMGRDGIFPPPLAKLADKLDQTAPCFEMDASQIHIIQEPQDFYCTLKEKIATANSRIFLSSLYIGKGQDELIQCVSDALDTKPDLRVSILTDALRGTREAPSHSSASLLAKLMEKHEDKVDIRMYHTPHLTGFFKTKVPKRFNEGFGLQHMKIYGFDEEVILSGANLSSDYFTNRQDRYYLFKSKPFADFHYDIQNTIGSLSYKLHHSTEKSNFKLLWPTTNPVEEPKKGNLESFTRTTTQILAPLLKPSTESVICKSDKSASPSTTLVYPVSQFSPLLKEDISTEKSTIMSILDYVNNPDIHWTFTAGYFNMLPEIKGRLINSKSSGTVITASPFANGFYQSRGVSKFLPDAYLYLARRFLEDTCAAGKASQIDLKEWRRGIVNTPGGWSYHAKGLWATAPDEKEPSVTVIGSSNYTRRAYNYDLETNAVILTNDQDLKTRMSHELNNLRKHTESLELKDFESDNRSIHPLVVLATKLLGKRL